MSELDGEVPRLPATIRTDVQILWDYHKMGHELRRVDVGVGLGSHDLGVATHAAQLYHQGLFPHVVFTGANAPTTLQRFPRGEAVHYREHAISLGVPAEAISIETTATNTGENLTRTRELLHRNGIHPASIILISRPYQQRRAYATCRKVWPEVDVLCSSQSLPLDEYIAGIGDVGRVITMLVGDTQRITEYARRGFAIPQHMPAAVRAAFQRLVDAGYTSRLV
ncbi:YdcF family protein [Actinocrispum sp. NPDC049592]|uniref:YdcF family protein n=1 Tax=Actinocrispum sp. NPDC049592 TaxID=3154835 RepID=UPI00343E8077